MNANSTPNHKDIIRAGATDIRNRGFHSIYLLGLAKAQLIKHAPHGF